MKTIDTEQRLRDSGYKVVSVWEHEIDALTHDEPALVEHMANFEFNPPFQPRSAYSGGRCENFKIACQVDGVNEQIYYFDIVSLYPHIMSNKRCEKLICLKTKFIFVFSSFPFGPICRDTLKLRLNHSALAERFYSNVPGVRLFGFVECVVLPPRQLLLPLLGIKTRSGAFFNKFV